MVIDEYLERMVNEQATDLYLITGAPPSLRVHDKIHSLRPEALTEEEVDAYMNDMLDPAKREEFESVLELNMAISAKSGKRFRANFYRHLHHTGIVIRQIKSNLPTLEEYGLPSIYRELIMEKYGLVLVVGATGSGKSTALAAMLNHRNSVGNGHIVTVEEPIEFIFSSDKCIFTQREIGIDTFSYGTALKNALRQAPDVIVVGEIRDREVLENALLFCEAGHLCVSTMHAKNSTLAIERMVNMFSKESQHQVYMTLSQNLLAIVSQRLVPNRTGTGRVVASEILLNQGLIKRHIEEARIKEIRDVMEKMRDQGMQTFDQSLLDLLRENKISIEVALHEADNPGNLKLMINQDPKLNPLISILEASSKNVLPDHMTDSF